MASVSRSIPTSRTTCLKNVIVSSSRESAMNRVQQRDWIFVLVHVLLLLAWRWLSPQSFSRRCRSLWMRHVPMFFTVLAVVVWRSPLVSVTWSWKLHNVVVLLSVSASGASVSLSSWAFASMPSLIFTMLCFCFLFFVLFLFAFVLSYVSLPCSLFWVFVRSHPNIPLRQAPSTKHAFVVARCICAARHRNVRRQGVLDIFAPRLETSSGSLATSTILHLVHSTEIRH